MKLKPHFYSSIQSNVSGELPSIVTAFVVPPIALYSECRDVPHNDISEDGISSIVIVFAFDLHIGAAVG
jgi:hypothetical protein